ncbi:trehalase-like domain-containing protein [Kitasatospora sp. NPDC059463]|uniref:trehalase-like domain-containing protein n=1 Tax=unclassified Kitasatospora TaxID=2633591 RepID=UPI0036C5CD38
MTGFPPRVLGDYALLADGERGALVGPDGEVAWLCAPHWDCDPVFEEYDIARRQLRGNLPQAFVHAMMLECAARAAAPPS